MPTEPNALLPNSPAWVIAGAWAAVVRTIHHNGWSHDVTSAASCHSLQSFGACSIQGQLQFTAIHAISGFAETGMGLA